MASTTPTGCCALYQIRACDHDSKEGINELIAYRRRQGTAALFCCALSTEKKLRKTLRQTGFKPIKKFMRREDHGEGYLTMYFLELREDPLKAKQKPIPIVVG